MHKSFIITEEDRNRILGMHENATKRQYLNEEIPMVDEKDWFKTITMGQGVALDGVNKIASAVIGWGTDPYMLIKGFQNMKDFEGAQKQLVQIFKGKDGYTSIENMLRGELEGDNKDDLDKIIPELKRLGYTLTYDNFRSGGGLDPKTIKIVKGVTQPQTSTQTWKPELENCLISSGGKKDSQGVYWFKTTNGLKIGYYSDGRYTEEGGKTWGKYFCQGNKISYYDYNDVKSPTNQTQNKQNTTQQPAYKIPPQLSNKDGVIKFQTWMEANHKGWYVGNKPIDGNFGKQTNAAWVKYGSEYMLSNPNKGNSGESTQQTTPTTQQNVGPLAPTPGLTFPNLPQ